MAGNPFYSIRLNDAHPELQFLEASACCITKLHFSCSAKDLLPSLLVLNLNHNGIKDIRPLRHMPQLKHLLLFGNRISDITMVVKLAATLPLLETFDLRFTNYCSSAINGYTRYNPCTNHFYEIILPSDEHTFCFTGAPYQIDPTWVRQDASFRSKMDPRIAMSREAYRNSVILVGKSILELDGIPVPSEQRQRSKKVLDAFHKGQNSLGSSADILQARPLY